MMKKILFGHLMLVAQLSVAQSLAPLAVSSQPAVQSVGSGDIQRTRNADYLQAQAGLANGDDISLYGHLASDPLYPYLAAQFYKNNLERDDEIIPLFQRFYAVPPIKKLHNRWIVKQYEAGNYRAVVDNYFYTGNEEADCAYRASQLFLGNRQAALAHIYGAWMLPKSVSTTCDPVFAVWDKVDDPAYRLKRARLAYHQGNANFAGMLAERLPFDNAQRATLQRFVGYLNFPESMLSVDVASLTDSDLARDLLPTALAALVRKDSSQYATFATQFAPVLSADPHYQTMLGKLTQYLAKRQDPQAATTYRLITKPNSRTTEALLTYLVGMRDWRGIIEAVGKHSESPMALYWLARAREASGQDAKAIYRKAATYRSYYGFLAADKIGQPYQFTPEITQPDANIQRQLDQNASLVRAKRLARYGDAVAARREILPVAKPMLLPRKRQLTYWLSRNGFHFEAIYILGKMRDWNDIAVRFPMPYDTQVQAASDLTGTDAMWIYAILRQESSMDPNAVSRARAKGLMQLIPSTARRMASALGLSLSGDAIFDPSINTQLGANYLAKMYERFGNIALASAAYNAGPGRVDEWVTRNMDDMTIWVETIPFNETRKYVKHILEYQQVYAHRLGKQIPRVSEYLNAGVSPREIPPASDAVTIE